MASDMGRPDRAPAPRHTAGVADSGYAWVRLAASLALSTLGGVGMWSVVVALPAVERDFGIDRASAALPYTLALIGFGAGGVVMGRLADRFGVALPVLIGTISLAVGYVLASFAQSLWQFALIHGVLIGFLGSSATFAPLVSDSSQWFNRNRGLAVAIGASGNYLAGTIWPPVVQQFIEAVGWRQTHLGIAVFCLLAMLPLILVLRRPPPAQAASAAVAGAAPVGTRGSLDLPPNVLQGLLIVAGLACCVAMSMPQVHIVALCVDLGYGAARGAEMLSLMLGFGIVSRLVSGMICDRIGGLATLMLGSVLQGLALLMYLPADGLVPLYIVSALFGLFQGGIIPSYAIIVREYFPAREAGARVGLVLMATLFGMALGGWLSGKIFDLTGSYQWAFLNGIAWNLVNGTIVAFLILRARGIGRRRQREAALAA